MRLSLKQTACAAVLACAAATSSLQIHAADDSGPQRATTDANSSLPSKTDSADTAFRKLDRSGKGYVTWEDIAGLPDFATAFGNADSTHLGRLNLVGFTKAWTAYVGGKN